MIIPQGEFVADSLSYLDRHDDIKKQITHGGSVNT